MLLTSPLRSTWDLFRHQVVTEYAFKVGARPGVVLFLEVEPSSHSFRFVKLPWEVARQSARDDDWETATSSLTSLMPHSVDELRTPLPIINVLASVAEVAGIVRDIERAAMLIPALQPYADQMAIGPAACELKLPVSSVLGRLRALTADLDGGVADCEAGHALAESMQTPLLAADSSIVLADVLVLRGSDTDIVRARELLIDAIGVSESCGAYGVADMGRRLLDNAHLP